MVVKRYRPWWDLSQGSMVSGGIGMDRVGCDVVQPGGQLFCSNRWGENAWCHFSGLVSSRLESTTPKMVSVFGSCEAEEKKKIIEIGIIQPLTGEIELHFRQVTTQIWDTEMLYNPIIVRTNLPTFREFGPIFDSGKSAECWNCSSTFHGYIDVKLKAILL